MDTRALQRLGLTGNEIKIYLCLLKAGAQTAYTLGQKTGIYRVHVYDKLEQLQAKGLVTMVYRGATKVFMAAPIAKIQHYLEEKRQELEAQEQEINDLLPELEAYQRTGVENTYVEVFKGIEGIKYFLKDIIRTKKEVLITGIDDARYEEVLSVFMRQYFRDLRRYKILERVITVKRAGIFLYDKTIAPTTAYRFLEASQFNPTNTFVYGTKVVIVSWGVPPTAVMIQNPDVAKTYASHFTHLWGMAATQVPGGRVFRK